MVLAFSFYIPWRPYFYSLISGSITVLTKQRGQGGIRGMAIRNSRHFPFFFLSLSLSSIFALPSPIIKRCEVYARRTRKTLRALRPLKFITPPTFGRVPEPSLLSLYSGAYGNFLLYGAIDRECCGDRATLSAVAPCKSVSSYTERRDAFQQPQGCRRWRNDDIHARSAGYILCRWGL